MSVRVASRLQMAKHRLASHRKGTRGQRAETRKGAAGQTATASTAQTRSGGPPVEPKPRKAARQKSEEQRLEMARAVVADTAAKARAERVAKRRGLGVAHAAPPAVPTGAAATEATSDGAPEETHVTPPMRRPGAAAASPMDQHSPQAAASSSGSPMVASPAVDAADATEAAAAEPQRHDPVDPAGGSPARATAEPARASASGVTPTTDESPRNQPPQMRADATARRGGLLDLDEAADESADECPDAKAVDAKVAPFGGHCWWCLERCTAECATAHDPDKCEHKQVPDMRDFKSAKPATTRGANRNVRPRGRRQSIRDKCVESDADFHRRREAARNQRKRALLADAQERCREHVRVLSEPIVGCGPCGSFTFYQKLAIDFALRLDSLMTAEQLSRDKSTVMVYLGGKRAAATTDDCSGGGMHGWAVLWVRKREVSVEVSTAG